MFLLILQLSGEKRHSEVVDITCDAEALSVGDKVAVTKKKRKLKPDTDATTSSAAQFVPHDYSSVNYKDMLQGDWAFVADSNFSSFNSRPNGCL